jgi:hypothetical protein
MLENTGALCKLAWVSGHQVKTFGHGWGQTSATYNDNMTWINWMGMVGAYLLMIHSPSSGQSNTTAGRGVEVILAAIQSRSSSVSILASCRFCSGRLGHMGIACSKSSSCAYQQMDCILSLRWGVSIELCVKGIEHTCYPPY